VATINKGTQLACVSLVATTGYWRLGFFPVDKHRGRLQPPRKSFPSAARRQSCCAPRYPLPVPRSSRALRWAYSRPSSAFAARKSRVSSPDFGANKIPTRAPIPSPTERSLLLIQHCQPWRTPSNVENNTSEELEAIGGVRVCLLRQTRWSPPNVRTRAPPTPGARRWQSARCWRSAVG